MTKQTKPVVNLPSQYRIMAMLNPSCKGKTDRTFIKMMCDAISTERYYKNKCLKQVDKHQEE